MAIILKLYIKPGALFHRPVKNDVEKRNQPLQFSKRASQRPLRKVANVADLAAECMILTQFQD
jgi:hypothetical protein